jgi:hypothetical protein
VRYVVLVAFEPSTWDLATPQQRDSWMEDHAQFDRFVAAHGRCIATAPLAGVDDATTVRHVDGRRVVTDGPFAETVEILAGYYDVELPDLDVAIEAAALLPSAFSIEIRPTIVMHEDEVG